LWIFEDEQAFAFNGAQVKSLLNLDKIQTSFYKKQNGINSVLCITVIFKHIKEYRLKIPCISFIRKNGIVKSLGGSIVTDFDLSINQRAAQRLSGTDAINIAVTICKCKSLCLAGCRYGTVDSRTGQRFESKLQPTQVLCGIVPPMLLSKSAAACYKIDVYATQPLSRAYSFVDALRECAR
jgi:hypothetical protein